MQLNLIDSGARKRNRLASSFARVESLERRALLSTTVFHLDPSRSSVSVSGNWSGIALQEQASGSLTTMYEGDVTADVTPSSITFNGPSTITADDNGSWQPGSTPGNYGGTFDGGLFGQIVAAVRGLSLKLSSGMIPIANDGTFSSAGETFTVASGTVDYDGLATGTADFNGQSSDNPSQPTSQYMVNNGVATLMIPIDATLTFTATSPDDTQITLSGTLVATADTRPLAVNAASFNYEQLPQSVSLTFNKDVSASLTPAALQVQNLTTGTMVTPGDVSYDAATNTATFHFSDELSDGRYRAVLSASSVADAGGNHLASDYSYNFFFLSGDVDHNGTVDFNDLLILARHYGQMGTYSQGDVNYDGQIDFKDLVLLARSFGHSLPQTAAVRARQLMRPAVRVSR